MWHVQHVKDLYYSRLKISNGCGSMCNNLQDREEKINHNMKELLNKERDW